MKFTYDAYAELIALINKENYVITNYRDYTKYEKTVIIKHDVDFNLEMAEKLAVFESNLGISTTYNILLCSDFYNPYSKKNMDHIMRIKKLGHEIGLHFDEVRYSENIIENIDKEVFLLESYVGVEVSSFSMHRPSEATLNANYTIKDGEIVNTYSTEFFKDFKYVSDSRRNWRENPIEIIESGIHKRIHILTHPIWYTSVEEDITTRLEYFLGLATKERYTSLTENIRDIQEVLKIEF